MNTYLQASFHEPQWTHRPGLELLREEVAATTDIEAQFAGQLGVATLSRAEIQQLSQNLLTELGVTNARTLAKQLFSITGGES